MDPNQAPTAGMRWREGEAKSMMHQTTVDSAPRVERQEGDGSEGGQASNFSRANRMLCQLNLKDANLTPVEERRALIFLLGWPDSGREEVLRAARDRSFVLGALPKEILKAAREDTIGHLPAAAPLPTFDPAVVFGVSLGPMGGAAASGMQPLQRTIRKRSPQTCKKCFQPRRGHVCNAGMVPTHASSQRGSSILPRHPGTAAAGLYASSSPSPMPAYPHALSSSSGDPRACQKHLRDYHPHCAAVASSSGHRHASSSDEETEKVAMDLSGIRDLERLQRASYESSKRMCTH